VMNSFSTSLDTKAALSKYPQFANFDDIELMQNKVPKVLQSNLVPAQYPPDPENEWCPPGHGDLYSALYGSGKLQQLLDSGYHYMFVSNSDNLGATIDPKILSFMVKNNLEFLMEVCERTEADKKGGHLSRGANGRLLLRESAQCSKEDENHFQNISVHKFFNTNNLWLDLRAVKHAMDAQGGVLALPIIRNSKTVNPTDSSSPKVFQLETAMGAAIELFDRSGAVVVGRNRFAPVKTCNDLLSLRSDSYILTEDFRVVLDPSRAGIPPVVDLEDKNYKFVSQFESLIVHGVPSLLECKRLTVRGKIRFAHGVKLVGDVSFTNSGTNTAEIAAGTYSGSVNVE